MNSAFRYVASKRDFDVEKLGPLKRFRKFLSVDQNGVLRWKTKIVLPLQFRKQALESAHDHPAAGHFAEDRTWTAITEKFFWPGAHDSKWFHTTSLDPLSPVNTSEICMC